MAPVGQTSSRARNSARSSRCAAPASASTGLRGRPRSSVGCSALLGQTFMHSPQRMQRERKSAHRARPADAAALVAALCPGPVLARISGTIAAPAARPVSVCAGPGRAMQPPSPDCGRSGTAGCRAGNCPRSSCTSGTRPCATARRRWDRRRPGSEQAAVALVAACRVLCAAPESTSARPRPAARPAGKSRGTRSA
jgi:hypothetical protein